MNITLERPFAATEKGGRNNNEDFIYPLSELADSGGCFFMVCDGVGGAERGEIASALACDSFKTFFNTFFEGEDPSEEFINKTVLYTESRFDEYVKLHPEAKGMATTLTFLYVGVSGITIAHIGDSRIYHIRDGKIIYVTEDHSLVNSWLQLGMMTKEEAAVHPQKNVITRAIMGSEHSVNADVKLITDIQPGDRFLMCTDGVIDCFTDEKLESLFSRGSNAESVKNMIVEYCTNEAKDNFSFYILPIQNVQKIAGYKQFILSFFYSLA
jgi:protein phosphatase